MPYAQEEAAGSSVVVRAEVDHGRAELVSDPDRPSAWTLLVDGTAQSHVDLDDPTHLEFEYVRRLGHVVDALGTPGAPLRVVHLGGGAWTLARYVAATRPGSPQTVVELDGALAELVRTRLPADDALIDLRIGDARAQTLALPPASTDLLVLDVFVGARIPSHLTSVDFLALAARALAPGGVLAVNLADGGPLAFARGQVATAAVVFGHRAVVAAADVWHGRRFGNLVLVASRTELPLDELARACAADPFPSTVRHGVELRRFTRTAGVVTDRSATPSPIPPPGFFGRPAGDPPVDLPPATG
ncbi:spermidine synthase [Pseudonocardia sp. N23]|uniref:spermidine synthase n=1 Tax=Pseudonocardia sp. N23 TaxID=1987376 RepID=UPI000C03161A|nr:fused MFS/spermidine synthase [Pseudonocardia sp. N23]GAY11718.1 spermidine synthase [Pseudonocardia sp. N23]